MKKLINILAIVCISIFFNVSCDKLKPCKGDHKNGIVKYVGDFCEYKIEIEAPSGNIIHLLPERLPARMRRDEKLVKVDYQTAEHPYDKAVCFENNTTTPTQTVYVKLKCIHGR